MTTTPFAKNWTKALLAAGITAGLLSTFAIEPVAAQDAEAPAAEKVTLTVSAPAGTSVSYVSEVSALQDIDMGGMAFSVNSKNKHEVTVTITAVDDAGVRAVSVKFDRVAGSLESAMMGGTVTYDSGDATGNSDPTGMGVDAVLGALGGKTLTAELAADGGVSDIEGVQAIVDTATGGNPMLAQFMSAADISETVRGFFAKLPEAPVAAGDTWTHDLNVKPGPGMSLDVATVLTATGIDDEVAAYTATTTVSTGEGTAAGTSIDESEGTGSGKISRADGLLVESSGENIMKLTMPNPQMPDASMSVSVKSSLTVKRVDATAKSAEPEGDEAGDSSGGSEESGDDAQK